MTNETQAIVSQFAALDIRSRKRTEKRGPSIDLVIERKHSDVTVRGARERKKKNQATLKELHFFNRLHIRYEKGGGGLGRNVLTSEF